MNLVRNKNIHFPELSYQITGLLFKVHNKLGRFKLEKQYSDYFEELLQKNNNLDYRREKELKNILPEIDIEGNLPDFIIKGKGGKIIIDLKSKKFITKEDYFQMMRYLEVARLPLGMIVNFRSTYLKPKRIINPKLNEDPNPSQAFVNSGVNS